MGCREQIGHTLDPRRVQRFPVENVEGRRLTFVVSINSDRGLVAAGKVTRVIVNRDRFIQKTNE